MVIPTKEVTNMAARMVSTNTNQPGITSEVNANKASSAVAIKKPIYAPTMKTSPCAKLNNNNTPYTMEYPRAIKA
jgi:hypothetical protein